MISRPVAVGDRGVEDRPDDERRDERRAGRRRGSRRGTGRSCRGTAGRTTTTRRSVRRETRGALHGARRRVGAASCGPIRMASRLRTPTRRTPSRTLRGHGRDRPAAAASSACALGGARRACARRGVVDRAAPTAASTPCHRGAGDRRRRRRTPPDDRPRRRPTPPDDRRTRRPTTRRRPTTPATPASPSTRSSGRSSTTGVEHGDARGAGRLRRPRRADVRAVPRPPPAPTTRTNKIGSLLVNPGGPGLRRERLRRCSPSQVYGEALLEHFDIVGWDPRGTGLSEPAIDCIDDYDRYFAGTDITPDDDAERQEIVDLAEEFADACVDARTPTSSSTSARTTRPATWTRSAGPSARRRSRYFGFSYGSELGATWATLFPDTVRAAVLDGAADPNADAARGRHPAGAGVRGHADDVPRPVQRRRRLRVPQRRRRRGRVRRADGSSSTRTRSRASRAGPTSTCGVARQACVQAMYSDAFWPQLVRGARRRPGRRRRGPARAVRQLLPAPTPTARGGNELEAFQVDQLHGPGRAADGRGGRRRRPACSTRRRRGSPPGTTGDYFCTFFPPAIDPRVEITGAGAGPIVVVGTTGDPATPLDSTRAMADSAGGRAAGRRRRRPAHRLRRQRLRRRRRRRLPRRPRGPAGRQRLLTRSVRQNRSL